MTKKEKAAFFVQALKNEFPDAQCSLTSHNALQLLIATRLSAQCTDARVNLVTPRLFETFPTVEAFAQADVHQVEECIRSCGLYQTKARDIVNMCRQMIERFDGKVPDNLEDLTSLSGIGRKTANLIMGDIYGQPAVVTDTHCIRITNRMGLVNDKDPYKVEMALKKIIDPKEQNAFCHRLVLHGRATCTARSPKCEDCCCREMCAEYLKSHKPGKVKAAV